MSAFCSGNPYHLSGAVGARTMRECLVCHSGSPGKPISICLGTECLLKGIHPLMRPYPPDRKWREYADTEAILEAGCRLEDGKTTCLSCHDLSKPPPHVVRDGDKLCAICHIGKIGPRLR